MKEIHLTKKERIALVILLNNAIEINKLGKMNLPSFTEKKYKLNTICLDKILNHKFWDKIHKTIK